MVKQINFWTRKWEWGVKGNSCVFTSVIITILSLNYPRRMHKSLGIFFHYFFSSLKAYFSLNGITTREYYGIGSLLSWIIKSNSSLTFIHDMDLWCLFIATFRVLFSSSFPSVFHRFLFVHILRLVLNEKGSNIEFCVSFFKVHWPY